MFPEFTSFQVDNYKKNSEIVHRTANQVMKDFGMFGLEITFSGNTDAAYEELITQLSANILDLLERNDERFFSLLYQIDIRQDDVLKQLPHPDRHVRIADMILRREMLKVLLVDYFKQNKNKNP